MIDSGMAKAVLDIFRDYCTQMCESGAALTSEDQVMTVVAQALIDILRSKIGQADMLLRLYATRTLAVVLRANPAFRQQSTDALLEILKSMMAFSPGENLQDGGLAAQRESSLLFTGHLIAILSSQEP